MLERIKTVFKVKRHSVSPFCFGFGMRTAIAWQNILTERITTI